MSMKEEQLRLVMDQESKIHLWNYIKYLGTYNIFIYSYASCTIIFVIFLLLFLAYLMIIQSFMLLVSSI